MATINPLNQFKALFPEPEIYRGQVVEVDAPLKRVKVLRGEHQAWVSGNVEVNKYVLVKAGQIVSLLPELPFARVEV